jgi:MoaA/NifB/PqqE/SkfB family radical SAM enzyme
MSLNCFTPEEGLIPSQNSRAEETQRFYEWGVRERMELVPTARKVLRDFLLLAGGEPEGPAIVAALERILTEAEQWQDRSVGLGPTKGKYVETLPEGLTLPHDDVAAWADRMKSLFVAVSHLGTYCHFNLKDQRKREASERSATGAPLLSKEQYQELKRKNSLLSNLEILLGRTNIQSFPLRMELDPTNECNLRCRGCRHGITKDFHHTEMRREYVEILSEAFPFVDYMYPIGTGEPTMSSTLPTLISEATRHGVKVDMLTNGTILERATLPWESFYRLGISVDGSTEETMRALRPVAPLAHVLKSLAELRAKAPQATIYAKVTVSRMNYDELPALMEKLADAGVNEVIVHSLDVFHPVHEAIQVRATDRAHMLDCVENARQAAQRRGMAFVNALNFEAAARHDSNALNKTEMFQLLKESPLPVLKVRELSTILETLEGLPFTYYPEVLVGAAGLRPAGKNGADHRSRPPVGLDTMDKLIQDNLAEARALTPERTRIPYCFLPWKMPIVDPDGRARACCHLPGHIGDLDHGDHFHDLWSGPGYVQLRDSMFQTEKLPDVCASCTAFDRSAYSDETLALADLLAVPIRQAPRYPVPMDVPRLLRTAQRNPNEFEAHSGASKMNSQSFVIPPGGQILARFPNPKSPSGVYYQGKFKITGNGRLLLGVKPFWGADLWTYMLDTDYTRMVGEWIGLPMPPLPIDFSLRSESECCVFLWAPGENSSKLEVHIKEFSGVVTAPGPSYGDSLQLRHFWSGDTA